MRAFGALGVNAADAAALALAVLVLAASLAPASVAPAAHAPSSPALRDATLDGATLRVAFDRPVRADGEGWQEDFQVTRDGVAARVWAARVASDGAVELLLPGGSHEDDDLVVHLSDGARLSALDGTRVEPGSIDVAGGAPPTALPAPRGGNSATLDGALYVFGGEIGEASAHAFLDEIVRLDLATGEWDILPTRLPMPLAQAVAVADPRTTDACPRGCIYVIGGVAGVPTGAAWGAPLDVDFPGTVLRFEPGSGSLTPMRAWPFSPNGGARGTFGGDAIYLFGGWAEAAGDNSDVVWRYDPLADELAPLERPLPYGLSWAPVVFDPRPTLPCPQGCVYALGGRVTNAVQPGDTDSNFRPSDLLRLEPGTAVAVPLVTARLPDPAVRGATAAWHEDAAYMVTPLTGTGTVLARFHPETGSIALLDTLGTFAMPMATVVHADHLVLVHPDRLERIPFPIGGH